MQCKVTFTKFCPIRGHYIDVPEGTPGATKVIVRDNGDWRPVPRAATAPQPIRYRRSALLEQR